MLDSLKALNAKRFTAVKVTKDYASIARRLVAAKSRYVAVQGRTGVPWPIVAVIHEREADQNFNSQLAQGDPLARKSTHVPRGQGPYLGADAWERAADVALTETGGRTWGDWSTGGYTTFLEKYNGLGYYNKGKPSPYVWAGTNQYRSGKYVADGQYSSTAVDTQPGCVALIFAMAAIDKTIDPSNLKKSVPIDPVGPKTTTGVVAGTAGALAVAAQPHLWPWIVGGVVAIIAALIIVHILESSK
jgi:lysozyme family protein